MSPPGPDPLAQECSALLERGELPTELLARVGDPEPAASAQQLRRALEEPELARSRALWLPRLLRSARPGFAAQCLHELVELRRAGGCALDLAALPALAPLLGASNFLARLLLRRPELVEEIAGAPPPAPDPAPPAPQWSELRGAKYRGLLRIAARDLLERPFAESLRELSDLADRCLAAAARCAEEETGVAAPAVLALGKLGGRELNFSSDVDLVFVYEAPTREMDVARNHELERWVRAFKRGLEVPGEEGFAYRVDLDLRPEGPQGPLANSVDAALSYYESFGAEWERQMLIRLRAVAGPGAAAESFARGIAPFVFRRLIDPGVARAVRAMKIRIEDERRRAGRDIDAELKEGPGGIRDVEFLVQALQLFHGGRHAQIRTGNVLDALERLGRLGLLPENAVADLREAYLWLRRAEHALQLAEERQTQSFPREREAQTALARRMGYGEAEGERARARLLDEWTAVRAEVRGHFEALVLGNDVERT